MSSKRYTFDTSVHKAYPLLELPKNYYWSSIVLLEIISSAQDDSRRKYYERVKKVNEEDGLLIVPTSDDWIEASKVIYRLEQDSRKKNKGKAHKKKPGASQRIALDALLGVSAGRLGVTVVTVNLDDFIAIQRYYPKLKVISPDNFTS
jgi:predicted nucleic acid-binding protein